MKLYIRALMKIIEFYVRKHPYLSTFLFVWCAGSIYIGVTSSWGICAGMIITVMAAVWMIWKAWIVLSDFGSSRAKTERKLKKQREREILLDYVKQGLK
ncbi:MAG TPA: hypothetical protein IAA05_04030 [Candidatus Blautia excrementipullorum]|nr:hypothetical protein [Candidatus Blautia excrementipullorum]